MSWRGLWGPRVGEGRVVSCSKCIVSLELEGIGKGVRGTGKVQSKCTEVGVGVADWRSIREASGAGRESEREK